MCIYVLLGVAYGLSVQSFRLTDFLPENLIALLGVFGGLALWYIAGTAFNDYADYEIDRINLKNDAQRPLVQGIVGQKQLLQYACFASLASFVIVLLTNSWDIVLLFAFLLILNVAYSLQPVQISRRGGVAPLLLPLGYIVLTVGSGMLLTSVPIGVQSFVLLVAMYLHFMARIVLKDHRDVRGDALAGKKTLVLKYGNKPVVTLAMALFTISTMLLLAVLWQSATKAVPFMLLLASGAVMTLVRLSQENRWPYQKPLITIFGRFCSGLVVVLIIGLIPGFLYMPEYQRTFVLVLASVLFFASIFDILRLQHPRSA